MHEPQKGIHESENEQDAIMFMMITTKLMLLLKDLSDMIFNRNIFVACDVFISVSWEEIHSIEEYPFFLFLFQK